MTNQPLPTPKAEFLTLVATLVGQARIGLGTIANPITKRTSTDLRSARFAIDLLGVLEEKTRGNLSGEEKTVLASMLADLRVKYAQASENKT
jgi:hypothetical protein